MKLIDRLCDLFYTKRNLVEYKRVNEEYDKIEEYLQEIKSNPVLLWNYIDLQKEGSIGWIMTREYRISRAHEQEDLRKAREIELYRDMANRIKIIKESEKEY